MLVTPNAVQHTADTGDAFCTHALDSWALRKTYVQYTNEPTCTQSPKMIHGWANDTLLQDKTALHAAATGEIVEALVSHGASVNDLAFLVACAQHPSMG